MKFQKDDLLRFDTHLTTKPYTRLVADAKVVSSYRGHRRRMVQVEVIHSASNDLTPGDILSVAEEHCRRADLGEEAQEYLDNMCDTEDARLADLTPRDAFLFLENMKIAKREGYDWPLDTEVWEAYAKAHNVPKNITPKAFYKQYIQEKE